MNTPQGAKCFCSENPYGDPQPIELGFDHHFWPLGILLNILWTWISTINIPIRGDWLGGQTIHLVLSLNFFSDNQCSDLCLSIIQPQNIVHLCMRCSLVMPKILYTDYKGHTQLIKYTIKKKPNYKKVTMERKNNIENKHFLIFLDNLFLLNFLFTILNGRIYIKWKKNIIIELIWIPTYFIKTDIWLSLSSQLSSPIGGKTYKNN